MCVIMPVAQGATCVCPKEIESELEAINLTFPFGLEQNIKSFHTLCFSLHSLFLLSLSVFISVSSFQQVLV